MSCSAALCNVENEGTLIKPHPQNTNGDYRKLGGAETNIDGASIGAAFGERFA